MPSQLKWARPMPEITSPIDSGPIAAGSATARPINAGSANVDDATARQVRAADPKATTWLSANAGSGKTRVLTDRVARLLLNGVEPQHILCLTYTKAAASEMQNRLFRRLGQWAMKADDDLRADLLALGEFGAGTGDITAADQTAADQPAAGLSRDRLAQARRLFARAIETPGGLRILTIHSFCASLLRRFPLEAGVSPQFSEMDDRAARMLREDIVEELALTQPLLMQDLARHYSGEDFGALLAEIAQHRARFAGPLEPDTAVAALGGRPGDSGAQLLAEVILGDEADLVARILPVLQQGKTTDQKLAANLARLRWGAAGMSLISALEGLFLTGANTKEPFSAKVGSLPTKDTRARLEALDLERLEQLMRRVEAARARRIALLAAEKTCVLHRFAAAFLPLYEARKASHGWLDFDDLIQRAKALLTDPSVAAWVLYRLDGGIDHILVDEAQDTGPDQWRVIELLAAEFTASEGAEPGTRTLFVVGDKKQSIYSFQGADVAAFDAKQAMFQSRFQAAGLGFQNERLEHSFRSSPAILSLVDATFAGRFPRALGADISHIAYRDAMPGRVDLWPLVAPADKADEGDWEDPVDLIADSHHAARLASDLASEIGRMIQSRTMISDQGVMRPCHAGDFLILVQRRSTVFDAIIAACKREGLPIAGADRLKLGAELAVRDIAALLSFLALPEDDLSLATALRSPLFGWSEAEIFDLAHQRPGYLWRALRDKTEAATASATAGDSLREPTTGEVATRTRMMLDDLRRSADFMRPYELIERLLTRWGGRARLIARLGTEAEDGIDELLSQALGYERNEVPSLTGFLTRLQTDDVDVKRQMEGEGHRIRVMTVHGSKGLEAPIVILPDTADRKPRERDELHILADGLPVWKTPAEASPPAMALARAARAEQTTDENLRLLYVALTRARCWLIICGAGEAKTEAAWYNLVSQGMQAVGARSIGSARLRWQFGDWPDASAQGAQGAQDTGSASDPATPVDQKLVDPKFADPKLADPLPADTVPSLPDWLFRPPLPAPVISKPLSPSDLGGAKILLAPGEEEGPDAAEAMRLGSLLHLLLERLPDIARADWPAFAESVFASEVLDEAVAVLSAPDCAAIFAPQMPGEVMPGEVMLAEVALTAPLGEARMIGTIDRLIIGPEHVLAVDFKSNRLVPSTVGEVPEGILRQMGAYGAALAAIYPERRIELAVLWTREARLMPLPHEIVSAALRRARAA